MSTIRLCAARRRRVRVCLGCSGIISPASIRRGRPPGRLRSPLSSVGRRKAASSPSRRGAGSAQDYARSSADAGEKGQSKVARRGQCYFIRRAADHSPRAMSDG